MNQESLLLNKLTEISAVLSKNHEGNKDIGVLSGISGIALFQFYYSRFIDDESYADIGVGIISSIIEKINEGYSFPTFCTGIAGAAWVIELLKEEEFIDIDSDELLSDLDDYLCHAIQEMGEEDNFYDFLHGTLGIGFYFFKRYQKTQSKELKNRYKEELLNIITLLENASQKEGEMIKWQSYLIREENLKGVNLSLSHGMMSIINFLSRLATENVFYDKAENLIKGAVNFVLKQENQDLSCSSWFPSWVYDGMETDSNARLAWCYGDLGIGITLWRAGGVMKNKEIQQKAIAILQHASKRRDLEESKIKDAALCHGAFGVAQIYNHMYKETKEVTFKETADFWLTKGLEMGKHSDGPAGYKQWYGGEEQGWREETNLLEGIAGIGLAMISCLATFDTKWDECLLIS